MSAVGRVEKLPGWVDTHLRIIIPAAKSWRQRGDGLQLSEAAGLRVIGESSHCRLHLRDHIAESAVGMECEMARARTGIEMKGLGIFLRECAGLLVESVRGQRIEPEIGHHGEAIIRREVHGMHMRGFLPFRVRPLTGMLY